MDHLIVEENVWAVPMLSQNRGLLRSDRLHNALFVPNLQFYDWSQVWLD